jgi:hypothetical protein
LIPNKANINIIIIIQVKDNPKNPPSSVEEAGAEGEDKLLGKGNNGESSGGIYSLIDLIYSCELIIIKKHIKI